MASPKTPKEKSKRQELREDRLVTLYARSWAFYDENKNLVIGGLIAFLALIVLVIGYFVYQHQQQQEAEEHLARIISVYERGDYEQALQGTGDRLGLIDISEQYGRTRSGNLATYYAADSYYRLDQYEEALEFFSRYSKDRDLLGASAIAAEASIFEDQDDFEEAGDRYRRAATFYESEATSPGYLLQSGRAYEAAGLYDRALDSYQMIRDDFPGTPEYEEVEEHIARAEARLDAE